MQRRGGQFSKYLGAACLLAVLVCYGAPSLLGAAGRVRAALRLPAAADPAAGLQFDGIDDRVTFGPAPALGAATFTIETWFRRDGPGSTATTGGGGVVAVPLVTKGMSEAEGDNRDTNYFLGIDGKRRVLAADFEDTVNGGNHPVLGVTPICDGVWYHAAATYDGTTWRLYLNGALETQLVVGSFTPRFDSIQQAAFATAMNSTGSAGGAFFGALDEPRIWNVVRTASEIQSTMTQPLLGAPGLIGRWGLDEGTGLQALDSTGNGNAGTLRNGTAWSGSSPFATTPMPTGSYGLRLKGTAAAADYVSFGNPAALGTPTFTVETWFKQDGAGVTTTTGTGGLTAVVPLVTKGRNDGDGTTQDINYFLGLSGNMLAADFEEGASGLVPGLNHPLIGSTVIQNNVWYHAAVTYDGVTMQLYLNGVLDGLSVVARPARADSTEQAAIGSALTASGVAAGFFAGSVDEVRVWNRARTAAEVASGRDREISAASGLIGRWSFNDCCVQPRDSSPSAAGGTLFGTSWQWVTGGPLSAGANAAPLVSAGPDQTITLPALALLAGTVTDDARTGTPVTYGWTIVSGPGGVTFGNVAGLASTVGATVAGTYVLALTANDGELSATDQIAVTVLSASAPNQAPAVNAGPDQTIQFPAAAVLAGSVSDDGQPGGDPTTTWSKVSGPGTVTFAQPSEVATTATFSAPGTYVLMLSGSDGGLSSSDTVTIVVNSVSANTAIAFNGSTYVTFGQAPGLGAGTFTLEAWFKRTGAGTTTTTGTGGVTAVPLVTKGRSENDGSTVDMNYFLGIRSDNVLVADFEEGASGASPGLNHPVAGATAIQNNVWYHAAATYDGIKWQLFLNGVLERELAVNRPPRADSIQHAAIASALSSTGAASGFFTGVVDEARIWSAARTQQQIIDGMSTEIASAPGLLGRWGLNETSDTVVADSTGHGITGTITGGTLSSVAGAPFNLVVNNAPDAPVIQTPANGGSTAPPATTLGVAVNDADGDPLTVTYYGRPKATTAPDFTYLTIPDTQHYVDNTTFPATFTTQTNWIVANRGPMNIAFVSHLGDIAEHIDQVELEWQRADTSMTVLDVNGIPYGVSPGNHDQSAAGVANFYDQYFGITRFLGRPWYGGYLGAEVDDPVNRLNKNNYELFSVGGLDFLVIHIEHDWPTYAVTWADKIIKRYPNRRVILSTHLFLNTSNARPMSAQFRADGTSAEAVWQQIVKPNCNVFMVVNGHYPGEGRRTDLNNCGQPVHQVLMDYQSRANGGDGWLRYFAFKPSENKIYAYTYSPTRGEFETDDSSQFVLDYNMQGTAYSVIATNGSVTPGSTTTATWSGLTPGTQYEWYVTVNDGKATTTGPVWGFTASSTTNTPPVAAADAYSLSEDGALSIVAPGVLGNDTDADDDQLSAAVGQGPSHGTLSLLSNGGFVYTPAANFNGVDSFTYTVGDGHSQSAPATVTLTIAAVNDGPIATSDTATTPEDTAVGIAVLVNDTDGDGDALTVVSVGVPAHGTATANGAGVITYTPQADYSGSDTFTYVAQDGHGGSATGTVTVTVTAANDAPIATNDTATTAEDTPVIVGVLANDQDGDGDVLSVLSVSPPAHGTAVIGANGTITYTPAANYSGPDSFTYTVSDGHGGTAVGTVTVTVGAVNDAPSATDDAATAAEDTPVSIAVLANDTDLDGDTLSVSGVGAPGHGSATANANGTISYAPAANYSGPDSFTYTVSDGHGGTAVGTVTMTVSAVNDAPAATNDAATTVEDTPVSIAVLANDTDLDADTLVVTGVSAPGHGTAMANANGTISYAPAANYSGPDSFTYTVSDGHGGTAVGTVTMTVSAVNDAPAATNDAATTAEDTPVSIAVLANDTDLDADTLVVTGVSAAGHGTATANADGSVTYTPAANYSGPDAFTYTVSDGHGGTAVGSVTVSVSAVNDAPAATDDAATTAEDTPVSVAVLANDTDLDGDTLVVNGVGAAGHGTATANADGTINYTPAANYSGPDSFTYTVSDGHGGTAVGTVTVTVSAVNDAPTATDDAATTTEDAPVSIAVLANDIDLDGDTLVVSGVGAAGHGTATANADGTISYTPAANYSGLDSFTYTVSDGHGGTATGTVTVTVSAVNDAPTATDDAATTTEDAPVSIAVLANDTDLDGDTLSVSGVGAAGHGTATANADGTISYTPAANYGGPDSFTYTVSDGHGGTAVGTVTVSISAVNDAPAATDDAATTTEDTPVSITVVANDTDLDGDSLVVSGVTVPAHGSATVNADGSVTYTPAANYSGPDSFTYTVNDGHGGTAVGSVTVSVSAVNDAPAATDDVTTTAEDAPVSIAVLANDTDLDGDTLVVSGVGGAAHGTATVNADGSVTYTPAANYSGPDSFTYTVSDGHGGTAVGTVAITVNAVNDAPAATDDAATTTEDTAVSVAVLANDADLDSDTLSVSGVGAAGHGTATANADGTISYTPAANYSGPDSFTYTVSDGHGGTATGTVTVTVSAVNDAPAATDDVATTTEDVPVSIAVLANDTDLDGDTLSVSGVGAAGHGTATANADGTIAYTPAANYSGPDTFTYTVSDGHGGTAVGTVAITVNAVNDAPAATDDAATTTEDTAVSVAVLANDTDLDSDTLSVSGVGAAGHGTAAANADGTISYTPAANYSGPDSFTYTVSDGHGGTAVGTVTVSVSAVNDAPAATDDAATTTEDAPVSIAVIANDTDLDGDTLNVSGVGAAVHGTATVNADGSVTYTPAANYSGADTFTYTVSDGHGGTAVGTVAITVNAVNDAPAATDDAATTAEDAPVSIAVLANDTDLDGDTLSVSGVGAAGHGTATANADGSVTYTPAANYSGSDSFTYTVSDGHGGTAIGTVTVTVNAVNDAPAATDDAATTNEDTPVSVAVLANDTDLDGDTLVVTGVGAAGHGTASANADGTITYTPAANYSGPDGFTYTVSDGHGGTAAGTVTLTVSAVNDAPVATDDVATTAEDAPVSIVVLANDTDLDGDTLVVTGVGAAGHGTASANADGTITYTPAANYSGPDGFTYTVSDGHGGTAAGTVTLTVSAVNDAPAATDDVATTAEDAPVSIVVLANDTDLDGDTLSVSEVGAAGHGTATANADGSVTYTPAANYSGPDSFTYTVSDGHGGTAIGTVTVTVSAVNDAPAATDDAATTNEDTPVSIAVLANDTDLDGDTLNVSGVGGAAHGTATVNADGSVTYTPAANYSGPDSFTYTVSDGHGGAATGTVTVSVSAVNDAPSVADDAATTAEDAPVNIAVLANDTDLEGDTLSVSAVGVAGHGAATANADGTISYTPAANYSGPDSFTYTVSDGHGGTAIGTVTVTVSAVNDAPAATDDAATTNEDTPVSIAVLANDTDLDGDTLVVSGVGAIGHGSATANADGTISYTPAANYSGPDSFTYTVSDGHGGAATGTVTVSVSAVNDAPSVADDAATTAEDAPVNIAVLANDTDLEGDTLSVSAVGVAGHGAATANADGTISYTPAANYSGPDSFTYTVSDGHGGTAIGTVTVTVSAVNDAPAATDDAATTNEDTPVSIAVLANDTDLDGDTLSLTGVGAAGHGTAAANADGSVTYTPAANYSGPDSFTYTVSDGHNGTATGTVTVTVSAVNDVPAATDDAAATAEDTAVSIAVLANDTDFDSDTLSVNGVGAAGHGTAAANADGSVTYTPAANYSGPDSFTYTVSDGHGGTAIGTVTVTVSAVNDPPAATDDAATTNEDTPVSIAVLANDTDVDGDTLVVSGVGAIGHGSATANADGTISYTPAANYSGPDSFTYTVSDGHGGAATGTVTVTVSAVNDAPTATDDAATTTEDASVSIAVLANDTDLDSDTLSVSGVGAAGHGTAAANADGSVTYTPAANYSGPDSFTYTVSDGHGGTAIGTVTVTVSAVNDAPAATDDAAATAEDTPVSIAVLANDTDLDGDTLSLTGVGAAGHGTAAANADGSVTYTPAANYSGPDSFTYTVSDGHNGTATGTVTVTVSAVNDVPAATDDAAATAEDTAVSIAVLANDTDLDSDTLSVSGVGAAGHGTAAANADGSVTYTPAANYSGPDSFTYTVSDGHGGTAVGTVTLTVSAVNDAPTASDDAATTAEDTPVSIAVLANDIDLDGDTLSVSGVGAAGHGTAAANADGSVTYTPAANYSGPDSFTYTVSDGHNGTATGTVTVTVSAVNDAPAATDDAATTAEDTPVSIAVLANDTDLDGDTLSVSGIGAAGHGTATANADGTISYTPAANYSGPDSFTYTVSDGHGGTAVGTVTVTVSAVNDAPSAADDAATTAEDAPVSIAVLANDTDLEGDTLSVSSVGVAGHGTATANADGTISYTPAANYSGPDTFTYTVSDGHGGTAIGTVTVTVSAVNDAPAATDDAATTTEDASVSIAVLANDTDLDSDTLSVSGVGAAGHGTATANADGTISYTPAANYSGPDSFTYTVSDGHGGTATGTVTVTVSAVNDAPAATDDAATTTEDTPVSITVLANDTDLEGDTLTVSGVGAAGHGTATAHADGTIGYTPAANYSGPDSFTYTVSDGHGGTAIGTVTMTVSAVNDAPAATDDGATTAEDTSVSIAVLANDTDLDGDTLSVTGVGAAGHGTATVNADGSVTYTPAANYSGPDGFTYTVSDGHGGTATGTVTVTVSAVNDAPAATDDAATTNEDTAASIAVLANDTDLDGDTLSVSGVGAAGHGTATVNVDGTISYTPAANYAGPDSFTYTVSDGHGGAATGTVTVTVSAVNDAPAATDDAATTAEDGPVSIAVLANDTDLDGDTLVVSGVSVPAHGTATANADGSITYTPAPDFSGPDGFTYTVTDGHGGTATGTVTVSVSAVNDGPAATDDAATTAEDTPVSITVLANDTDLDGDTLVVSGVGAAGHGIATANADGTIGYTPGANYSGPDSFTYTVSDGHGGTAVGTVSVTVSAVNDAPAAIDDAATTVEDTPAGIAVLANDSDLEGDTLSVSGVGAAGHGTATVNADGTISYTPAANYSGPDSFTYTVSDGHGGTAVGTVTITVSAVNDAPTATDDATTTAEDTPVSLAVLANDIDLDADTLVVSGVSAAGHGTATANADGSVTYTPAANYSGPDSFTYTVSDGHGGTATGTVTVTVSAVNDAPTATDDAAATAEDAPVSVAVLVNDTDLDGDSLVVGSVSAAGHGTATTNADGTITYTPAANYSGPDSFTYTVNDGHGGTAIGTVTLTVSAVNDAPAAADDAATAVEDTPVSIAVLANDIDPDGDTLVVSGVSVPAHGTATANADGTITYAPAANYSGPDSFTYTISDGHDGTVTGTVAVIVSAVNDAPSADDDATTTAEDTAVSVTVLANDTDLDGDIVSVSSVTAAAHGNAVINPDGTIVYTPAANYHGADSFGYTVGDGHGGTATATVTVTVTGVNDSPIAVNDAVATAEDTAASVTVLANDTDLDGDLVSVSAVTAPAHGNAVINPNGTITYTPAANYHGADSFSYSIGDGNGGLASATVSVTVTPANDVPVPADDTATTAEDTPVTIAVLANDVDPDGDPLSVAGVLGAMPSIAATAGSWSHGASVTIAGSGFGVKPAAAPTVWDDASGNRPSDKWDGAWPNCSANSDYNLAYRTPAEVGRNIALPHTHASRYIAGAHFGPVPDADCGYSVMMWKVRTVASFPAYSYASWYQRADDNWQFGGDDNFKTFAYSLGTGPYSLPDNWYIEYNGAPTSPTSTPQWHLNDDGRSLVDPDENGHNWWWGQAINPMAGAWTKIEMETKYTNLDDGYIKLWENGVLQVDYRGKTDGLAGTTRTEGIGGYARNYSNSSNWRYFADVYLDASRARVILGNAPTLSASTVREVQVPTAWSDSAITVSVNLGSFADGAEAYLYVVGVNGEVNAAGVPVSGSATPGAGTATPGSASVNADGTITYTPAPNYSGPASFAYTVDDGHGGAATATVHVTVTPANDGPVAGNDAAAAVEDASVSIAVLANDTDLEGDSLAVTGVSAPANGMATANADGTITYTPAANYSGPDSFTYTVTDGHGGTATGTVTVTVSAVNDAPAATDDAATTAEDTPVSIAVLGNDTDLDGDTLTVSGVGAAGHGTATANADGTITYTPAGNYSGPDSFTYTVGDGHGGTATGTVTVTVSAANDAPAAADDSATTAEDTPVSIALLGNDSDLDGDALTVSGLTIPGHGAAVINTDGTVTYTPADNYSGADSFTYTVSDGHGGTANGTVVVTVSAVNDAPAATDDGATTAEDTPVSLAVLANDTDLDGDALVVSGVSVPAHGAATANADGTISYTPAANYSGPDSFTYTVNDGHGGSASGTVTVTVSAVNDAPAAIDDAATTTEDTPIGIAVLANDTDLESDTLTVSGVGAAGHGTAAMNADGSVTYTPAANYSGPDSFTYIVSDGHGGTAVGTVTVTVTAANDAPAAGDDTVTTAEDTPGTIAVLANDTDLDGDSLVVSAVSGAAHGTVTLNPDGTVTYTPAANYSGPDGFTYTVGDGHEGSATGTVTVTVTAVNDAPAAADDAATTAEDAPVGIAVLGNDTDLDGDTLVIDGVSAPGHGTATANADGSVTYTPAANYSGPDSFTYTVSDGHGGTAIGTVTVTVTAANDAPAATDDALTTAEDTPVGIAVLANDTDLDGDSLVTTSVGVPAHGTATANADGTVTYAPAANYSGPDSFTYTVSDGHGGTAVGTVTVTVTAANDAPAAAEDAATTAEDAPVSIAVLANDTDLDGDTLTVSGVGAAGHGTAAVNADGSVTYTPAADYYGPDSFIYTVSDGHGSTASGTVTMTVTAANDAPSATGDAATTAEDTPVSIAVLANDSDVDGDTVGLVSVSSPAHGTATINPDGTITYAPAADYNGTDTFSYVAGDGHGGEATATVTIAITAVPDAPMAQSDSYSTNEDVPLNVGGAGVLGNDSDPDGGQLTAVLVSSPAHGTLSLAANGQFIYAPVPDASGVETFSYKVSKGSVESGVVVVTIEVLPVNDAPSAEAQSVIARFQTPTPIVLHGQDVEGDALTFRVVASPSHGTLSGTAPDLVYTPQAGFAGADTFSFVANDGFADSSAASVTLQVRTLSRPPEAEDQWMLLDEDTSVEITLNAGDPDGDPLTFTIVTPPQHGTLTGSGTTLIYTPDPDYSGDDRFTFRVSDGMSDSNDASVDLWIWSVNDPPVVQDVTFAVDPGGSIDGQLQATDQEEDWVFFWFLSEPSNGTVTLDPMSGTFTYEASPGSSGYDSFSYTVYDWQSQGTVATIYIVPASVTGGGAPPSPPPPPPVPPAQQSERNR